MGLLSSPLYPWDTAIRPAWYDRDPVNIIDDYDVVGGPHAANERLTYTCPKGRTAFIELIDIEMIRVTVAAPVGDVLTYVTLAPVKARYPTGRIATARLITNVIGDNVRKQIHQISLFAGDAISTWTVHMGTGGTVRLTGAWKIVEFDARDPKTEFYRETPTDVQEGRIRPDPVM